MDSKVEVVVFYRSCFFTQKPAGISNEDLSDKTRRIFSEELYPLTDIAQGQSQVVNTLDLSCIHRIGPYIIIIQMELNPADSFGGIMRPLNFYRNFEQKCHVQFWV
jgi:cell surface protein SprA